MKKKHISALLACHVSEKCTHG